MQKTKGGKRQFLVFFVLLRQVMNMANCEEPPEEEASSIKTTHTQTQILEGLLKLKQREETSTQEEEKPWIASKRIQKRTKSIFAVMQETKATQPPSFPPPLVNSSWQFYVLNVIWSSAR